ncbi:hypothetical protein P8452_37619 [Trifolium repens]|nr:hypothetical protein P8452_37619 [Trifolium repens]
MAFTFPNSSRKPTSPARDKETERHTLMSFRDKVFDGAKLPVMHEKVDLLAQKLVQIENVCDYGGGAGKKFAMLYVDTKVIDELSVPWKDVLAVKLLDKDLLECVLKLIWIRLW